MDDHTTTAVESAALGKLAQLPPFSPVALAVLRSFDREVEVPKLARLIGSDAALASEILACTNSPLFGLQVPVTDLRHAITVLGIDRTKALTTTALTTTLTMRSLLKAAPKAGVVRRLWRHNVATSAIAAGLAPVFGVVPGLADTAGILRDLGRTCLLAAFRDGYPGLVLKMYDTVPAILEAERELCDTNHCEAGLLLSRAWGFPTTFQQVIGQHHERSDEAGLLGLIQTSCALADDLGFAAIAHMAHMLPLERLESSVPKELRLRARQRWPTFEPRIMDSIEALDT